MRRCLVIIVAAALFLFGAAPAVASSPYRHHRSSCEYRHRHHDCDHHDHGERCTGLVAFCHNTIPLVPQPSEPKALVPPDPTKIPQAITGFVTGITKLVTDFVTAIVNACLQLVV